MNNEYWKIRDLKELIKIHEKDEPSSITRDYIQDLRIKVSLLEEGIQEGKQELWDDLHYFDEEEDEEAFKRKHNLK